MTTGPLAVTHRRRRSITPRAVADASRGPEKLSSTIRSFSAADHRRRRPVSTISRRLIWRVSVKVIHTDNQLQAGQFDKAAYVG